MRRLLHCSANFALAIFVIRKWSETHWNFWLICYSRVFWNHLNRCSCRSSIIKCRADDRSKHRRRKASIHRVLRFETRQNNPRRASLLLGFANRTESRVNGGALSGNPELRGCRGVYRDDGLESSEAQAQRALLDNVRQVGAHQGSTNVKTTIPRLGDRNGIRLIDAVTDNSYYIYPIFIYQLRRPVVGVTPANITTLRAADLYGRNARMIGWAAGKDGKRRFLKQAMVKILTTADCEKRFELLTGFSIPVPEGTLCSAADPFALSTQVSREIYWLFSYRIFGDEPLCNAFFFFRRTAVVHYWMRTIIS